MNEEQMVPSAVRQEKHRELDEAIVSLASLVQHADSVIERIGGVDRNAKVAPAPAPPEMPKQQPSLREVLEAGPSGIRDKVEEVHRRLDSITELLF